MVFSSSIIDLNLKSNKDSFLISVVPYLPKHLSVMMPTVTFSFLLGYGFEMNVNHMLRRVYLWEASRPLNSVTDFQKHDLIMSFKLNNNVPQVICTVGMSK